MSGETPDLSYKNSPKRVAVIDIGSNSVRLVVYDGAGRAPMPVFNEKVLCGLGRGLASTGKLSEDGYARCIKVLPRFSKITRDIGVDHIDILATAAVRDASNGQALIDDITRICGLEVRVLSGKEEARLSALGVISGSPDASGLVGDLGGGSMELVAINNGMHSDQVSLPLGPLRQWDLINKGRAEAINLIDDHINNLEWLNDIAGKSLYVTGGAWRSLAKLHMEHINYPLHVIHNYEIPVSEALSFTNFISNLSANTLKKAQGVSVKRIETIPYAALLLNRLMRRTAPRHLMFSAYSIREGCLYDKLPENIRERDPLIEASQKAQRIKVDNPIQGDILAHWIASAFADDGFRDRLRLAICHISDIGRSEHPDYRADHAMMRVLRYPYVGITHRERAFVGLAVATRYGNVLTDKRTIETVKKLLTKLEKSEAKAIGSAIRLAYNLSGGVNDALTKFKLARDGQMLILHCPENQKVMFGEIAEKRLRALSDLLDCQWEFKIT